LQVLRDAGENLNNALHSLSLTSANGQLVANRAFWDNLIGYYRGKANQVVTALAMYQQEQAANLIAGSDASRVPAASQVDFWGDIVQDTGYEPAWVNSPIKYGGIGQPDLATTELTPPPGLGARLKSQGLTTTAFFAELLGLVQTDMKYIGIVFLNQSIRFDCFFNMDQTWEGNFWIYMVGALTSPGQDQYWLFTAQYTSPVKNLSKITDAYGPIEFDCTGLNHADSGPDCESQQYAWCDRPTLLKTMWNSGNEPPSDSRPIAAVSPLFSSGAVISSLWDLPPDGGLTNGYPTVKLWLEASIQQKLRALQIAYYQNAFNGSNPALQTAAAGLSDAKAVLQSFIRLAFPQSYATGDTFRSFFQGSDPLPDGATLAQLAQDGITLTQNSLDHRDRIDFGLILNQRLAALETAISNKLTTIELAGQAESLPVLTDTLNQIAQAEGAVNMPLSPPWLFLSSTGTNALNVLVLGQGGVPYSLQYSTNLAEWLDFNPPMAVYGSGSQTISPNGANRVFIRARVSQ
jgi:hypothetical protein